MAASRSPRRPQARSPRGPPKALRRYRGAPASPGSARRTEPSARRIGRVGSRRRNGPVGARARPASLRPPERRELHCRRRSPSGSRRLRSGPFRPAGDGRAAPEAGRRGRARRQASQAATGRARRRVECWSSRAEPTRDCPEILASELEANSPRLSIRAPGLGLRESCRASIPRNVVHFKWGRAAGRLSDAHAAGFVGNPESKRSGAAGERCRGA